MPKTSLQNSNKILLHTSRLHLWRLCWILHSKSPTHFCVKSKCYEKTFKLFSGKEKLTLLEKSIKIFHQNYCLSQVKHIFDNFAKNFWAEHVRNSFSNIEFRWEKWRQNLFPRKLCFFSKWSSIQVWRLCWFFQQNVMKKLHFSPDNQFFIKHCLYRWNIFLTVEKKLKKAQPCQQCRTKIVPSQNNFLSKYRKPKDVKHKIVLQTQNAVLTTVQKNCRQKLNSFPLQVQNWRQNLFPRKLCFFSKWSSIQVDCTSGDYAEFFQQESNTFLCKVQMLWKSFYTFQRTTNFSSNIVCTGETYFWQLCQKFLSWTCKKFILKYRIWWEKLTLLEKSIKIVL